MALREAVETLFRLFSEFTTEALTEFIFFRSVRDDFNIENNIIFSLT